MGILKTNKEESGKQHPKFERSNLLRTCDIVDIGMSDHSLVIVRRTHNRKKASPLSIATRSFKNFIEEAFLNDLSELDWSGVTSAKSVDSATETFNLNVLNTLNKHAPCVKRKIKASSSPWVNEELLNSIKERDYFKKRASQTKLDTDWQRYRQKRNSVNHLKKHLKKTYYRGKIHDKKHDLRKLWKTLNEFILDDKESNSYSKTLSQDGVEVTYQASIANIFNNFFVSIGPKLASTFNFSGTVHINPKINAENFHFGRVTNTAVSKMISKLDNGKATGLYEIGVRAIKAGAPVLSIYLSHNYIQSLLEHRYCPILMEEKASYSSV